MLKFASVYLFDHPWNGLLVPIVVVLIHSYGIWAFCHQFCYEQLYKKFHHKATYIGLVVTAVFLTVVIWFIWIQLLVLGPGRQPKILPFKIYPEAEDSLEAEAAIKSILPPNIYSCDEHGYPIWCSNCQSLKMARTHHSHKLGYCIPRFDHYCRWVGTVIGRRNYRLFIQFAFYFILLLIIVVISVAVYLPKIKNDVNSNVYAIFGMSCVALLMVGPLLITHIHYMAFNRSSIEVLEVKRKTMARRKFFCVFNPADGYRYVIEFLPEDNQDFWDKHNIWLNFIEFLGPNILFWFIPWKSNVEEPSNVDSDDYYRLIGDYHESMSTQFQELLFDRIKNNNYLTRLLVYGDDIRSRTAT